MIRILIQMSRYSTRYDTLCSNKTRRVLARVLLVGSKVCTADKPSCKHACVCCVHHLEYDAKHCSAWIFLVSLFGKSLCIRKKVEGLIEDSAFPCLLMHTVCKCIINIAIACSMYDIRIVAKHIAMYRYTSVLLQPYIKCM